ncbi:LytTR family DNA-binding domain-containing protein [Pelagicoccus sp. SDUM812002]|uniref:LytR/AlgR family response regulator transcription factor n=1 Tax=Pelagicoccus sp. SDUM812002 TaxID=3041266 RepID=UPI00280E396C|nr:LytTR family DNA-binding domain-containing protein [Pelagicoccus sp. SDUM812002]MDQ8187490.1 LytTR family DNA-binding domain-containing protein [Pelagicoccus sp. SDUM812002]
MKLLIIEDEASIMDRLCRLVRNILGDSLQSLETATTLPEARKQLDQAQFDVLMLDLNLNGQDGFELLKKLSSRAFHTIVVSAYTQRAIEAYDLGVIDFIPKPFDEERIKQSFKRILGSDTQRSHFAKFLAVRNHGRIELVPIQDIEYIQADGPCSLIAQKDGSLRSHDKMLKDLHQLLPPQFDRVHKSYLANLESISGLYNGGNHKHTLTFPSGRDIPLSRSKAKELRNKLES